MKIIKGVLEEELENSLRMKEEYERAIDALPRGALVKKRYRSIAITAELQGHPISPKSSLSLL